MEERTLSTLKIEGYERLLSARSSRSSANQPINELKCNIYE
jgi:hypothetical protein